jgi:hypothetical protein
MPVAYEPSGGSSKSTTARKNRSGTLDEDAGTVAGVGVGARRAPVLEVADGVDAVLDDRWLRRPLRSTTKLTPQESCSADAR